MIQQVMIENFKAFGTRQCVPLAPITLLYGRNSAGKSSVIQALSLLKQTDEQRDLGGPVFVAQAGRYADLGSFQDIIHGHDLRRQIRIGLVVNEPPPTPLLDAQIARQLQEGVGLEFAFGRRSPVEDVALERLSVYKGRDEAPIISFSQGTRAGSGRDAGQGVAGMRTLKGDGMGETIHSFMQEIRTSLEPSRQDNKQFIEYIKYICDYQVRFNDIIITDRWNTFVAELRQLQDLIPHPSKPGITLSHISPVWQAIANKLSLDLRGLIPIELHTRGGLPSLAVLQRMAVETGDVFKSLTAAAPELDSPIRQLFARHLLLLIDGEEPSTARQPWEIGRLAVAAGQAVAGTLRKLQPIGPLRRPVSRYYAFGGTTPTSVGIDGQQVPELLFRHPDLVIGVNEWLRRLEVGYELKVRPVERASAELFEIRLFDVSVPGWTEVSPSDVGFGISQILPVIVQSIASSGQVVAVEQPEVHVHPRLQAEMGDLFIEAALQHGNQFILETHSEHLALRIQKRVREGVIRPDDVCVLYVERGAAGSTITRIPLDEDGDFTESFPGGFFTERLRELRRG